jgi:branched-subunit amino acid transport protein
VLTLRMETLLVILGGGLVTVLARTLPFIALRAFKLPDWVSRWLAYVPPAVLGALLTRELFLQGGHIALPPQNLAGLAILPALAVAIWRRSLIGTVLAGVGAMALLRWWLA